MFESMTHVLGAPKDWDPEKHGECSGLPVAIDKEHSTFTSCWQPTSEEIAAIVAGGRVYVTIVNGFQPPLHVEAKK